MPIKKVPMRRGMGTPTVPEANRNKAIWNEVYTESELRKLMISFRKMAHEDVGAAKYIFDRSMGAIPAAVPEGSSELIAGILAVLAPAYYGAE